MARSMGRLPANFLTPRALESENDPHWIMAANSLALALNALIPDDDKIEMISTCVCLELATPSDFLLSNIIAELIGMAGWEDKLTECIANVSATQ